jgi:hypothetical protein
MNSPGQEGFIMVPKEMELSVLLLVEALKAIARGRRDNGRPLSGEDSRQTARKALVECGLDW